MLEFKNAAIWNRRFHSFVVPQRVLHRIREALLVQQLRSMPVTDRYSTTFHCTSHNYGPISIVLDLLHCFLCVLHINIWHRQAFLSNDYTCFICQSCKSQSSGQPENIWNWTVCIFCLVAIVFHEADLLLLTIKLSVAILLAVTVLLLLLRLLLSLLSFVLILVYPFFFRKFSCFDHHLFIYSHFLSIVLVHTFMYSLTHTIMRNISCVSPGSTC
jgi:hypothetical protein